MKIHDPFLQVPDEIARKATDVKNWMQVHCAESVCGLGDVADVQKKLDQAADSGVWLLEAAVSMQRQLAAITLERDQYKSALELADRLRMRDRAKARHEAGAA